MPFNLYKVIGSSNRGTRHRLVRRVALAGRGGPFSGHVKRQAGRRPSEQLQWEMEEADILKFLGAVPLRQHRLLIDLKPNAPDNVNLFRLRRVWGFSYRDWSPVALQLEWLMDRKGVRDTTRAKREFVAPDSGDLVHEFLYLRGGTKEGTWTWGRVGFVNGALLWPDAFNHFTTRILPFTQDEEA